MQALNVPPSTNSAEETGMRSGPAPTNDACVELQGDEY